MRTLVSTPTKAALVSLLALLSFSATTANAQVAHLSAARALAVFEEEPDVQPLVYADVTCFLFTPTNGAPFVRYRSLINFQQIGSYNVSFNPSDGEPYEKWIALRRINCRAEAEGVCNLSGTPGVGTFNTVTISNNILGTPTLIHQCSN